MATSDSNSPPLSPSYKENLLPTPMQAKVDELTQGRTEIQSRIQSLKQDLQNWKSRMENQVKSHREELTELRKSLNVEVDQLRSEFKELRTTLQQQQEEVTTSLRNMGLQDSPIGTEKASALEDNDGANHLQTKHLGSSNDKTKPEKSEVDGNESDDCPPSNDKTSP